MSVVLVITDFLILNSIVRLRYIMRKLGVNPRRAEVPHHLISRAVSVRAHTASPQAHVSCIILHVSLQLELATSGSLKGYRAMWRTINGRYGLRAKRLVVEYNNQTVYIIHTRWWVLNRDNVMVLLRHTNPDGTALRKSRRMRRRTYRSKVSCYCA